ncbi:MAG: 23S rRNA (adenine(2503)-C(2))-methyltransferase RlmN [Anaeroplasmataceae bacterium]
MINIYNLTIEELKEYFVSKGLKPFRATQVFEWLYRSKIENFSEITNIKKDVISMFEQDFKINTLKLHEHQKSEDNTSKFLFELEDGNLIESVLMMHPYGNSLCVTSQVGCNMGCSFCASGLIKKIRNLEVHEIVNQVMSVSKILDLRISHVVVMGIGEPFDNYDNVIKFLQIINNPFGLEIGARHITVSTCGLVPKIYDYANEPMQSNLAISLHAATDSVRNKLMPINKSYDVETLIKAIKDYIDKTNRRVTIEYILIDSINDSLKDAIDLAKLLRGLNVYVNLIPYNEVADNQFKRSSTKSMDQFFRKLKSLKINTTLRVEHGHDIDAACGQLRNKYLDN